MSSCDGKNVVIIGGSTGLGRATAQLLADARGMITGGTGKRRRPPMATSECWPTRPGFRVVLTTEETGT
ncbi:MAG TPA: hypothetical protein VI029_21980 [Mycobacterium sp.]